MRLKHLLVFLGLFLVGLASQATSMTTAERLALTLGSGDAGYTVYDSDLTSQFWWTGTAWIGFPVGVPVSETLQDKRIGIVAGSMKQRASDRTKWDYQNSATRRTVGVSGTNAVASGYDLTVTYDTTYSRVITFLVCGDQYFANVAALSAGASVGLSSAAIRASAYYNGSFVVYWNGSVWTFGSGAGQNISPALSGYTNGVLTVSHAFCQGIGISASPWTQSGALSNPYIPCLKAVNDLNFALEFFDTVGGTNVTLASPSTRMSVAVTKINSGGLPLDGTSSATSLNGIDPTTNGELFFFGIFEK